MMSKSMNHRGARARRGGHALVKGGALLCALSAVPALASQATDNLVVGTYIPSDCEISGQAGSGLNAALIDFGTRDQLSNAVPAAATPSSGTGALLVRCNTPSTAVSVTFGSGVNQSGTQRRLAAGANFVDYDLYQDSGYTQPIGTAPVSLAPFSANETRALVVYGRVPRPLQAIDTSSGQGSVTTYTDTIGLTLTF